MFVEYIVKSDEPFHDVVGIVQFGIIEVEDERDKGEERCCTTQQATLFTNGEVHLYLYGVTPNWRPGAVYERMLRAKLLEDGCELEHVVSIT